jgi:uncharacterized protein
MTGRTEPPPVAVLVDRWYAAVAARDWSTLRELVHPRIEFIVAEGFPAGGRYCGRDAVFEEFFPASFRSWSAFAPVVDEVFSCDDAHATIRGRYVGTAAATGRAFDVPFAHLWRGRDGQLTWLQQYIDTALLDRALA